MRELLPHSSWLLPVYVDRTWGLSPLMRSSQASLWQLPGDSWVSLVGLMAQKEPQSQRARLYLLSSRTFCCAQTQPALLLEAQCLPARPCSVPAGGRGCGRLSPWFLLGHFLPGCWATSLTVPSSSSALATWQVLGLSWHATSADPAPGQPELLFCHHIHWLKMEGQMNLPPGSEFWAGCGDTV